MRKSEKRLKDLCGFQVWKIVDQKETIYMLNTQVGDNVNCFKSLKALKEYVKVLYKK
ncbi:hypothetical protein M2146_002565 [Lachnospiraceae bacterium PF1-22]